MLGNKMRYGGCGCDRHTQSVCRCRFCKSKDCNDNRLQVKGPVIPGATGNAGFVNTRPINKVQDFPCFWNVELRNIGGADDCLNLNGDYVIGNTTKFDDGGDSRRVIGRFNFCDAYEEYTPFNFNMRYEGFLALFIAGDDPLNPGSGVWNGIDRFCSATGYLGYRPKVWCQFQLTGTTLPFVSGFVPGFEDGDYGVIHHGINKHFYAKTDITYSGDYRVTANNLIEIPDPDCDQYYDTGDIDCNNLDVTFSGFSVLYDYYVGNTSGCTYCDFNAMTLRVHPYSGVDNDYYVGTEVPDSQGSALQDYHVSSGYTDMIIRFNGIISESDLLNSGEYRRGTCDCSFLNGQFYNNTTFENAADNRNRKTICCECPESGSPCINEIVGEFSFYNPSGYGADFFASQLEVQIMSQDGVYASYRRRFDNVGSGQPERLSPSMLQDIEVPYYSGVDNQSKCYANSGHCYVSVVQPRNYECRQYNDCNVFCDWKGPDEVFLTIPSDFYTLRPPRYYKTNGGFITKRSEVRCNTDNSYWSNVVSTSGLGGVFYDDTYVCHTDGTSMTPSASYTYSNCATKVGLMETGTFALSKIGQCTYRYIGYDNPKYYEIAYMDLVFSAIANNISANLTIVYGSGYYNAVTNPTNDCNYGAGLLKPDCPGPCFDDDGATLMNTYNNQLYFSYSASGYCGETCLPNDFTIDMNLYDSDGSYGVGDGPSIAIYSGVLSVSTQPFLGGG